MKAEQIFTIANLAAIAGWLLLTALPRWRWTRTLVLKGTIPLLFSAAYLALIVIFWSSAEGGFGSLPDVMKLFTSEWVVLAGWLHYLAFDLFVGAWEVSDARENGISHFLVIPCLFCTFMFGPIGFLLYWVIRIFFAKEEAEHAG